MNQPFKFTFENIKNEYQQVINLDYQFITCQEYVSLKKENKLARKTVVNRVDIDFSVRKVLDSLKYLMN